MVDEEMIYLDNNATTPLDDDVRQVMINHLKENHLFGNASSTHLYGQRSRKLIEQSRKSVQECLQAEYVDEILFTSGGTESNNLAIRGILCNNDGEELIEVITSPFEHPSVIKVLENLPRLRISFVQVNRNGIVDLDDFRRLLTLKTKFVTIMHANNEIGSVQPIKEIVRICRENGSSDLVIHSDASQSIGKLPVHVKDLDIDLLTICSHKFHGPKGIGALYVRRNIQLEKTMFGAEHEKGLRPGTENLLAIEGLGKICQILADEKILKRRIAQMKETRDRLYQGLIKRFEDHPLVKIQRNGSNEENSSLPNTLNISFSNVNAKELIQRLANSLAFSTGSACHQSSSSSISSTLQAIGLSKEFLDGTMRLTTSYLTTNDQIDRAIELLSSATEEQISISNSETLKNQTDSVKANRLGLPPLHFFIQSSRI